MDFRRHRQKNLTTAYHEEYFGFWGFTPSDYIRNLIMDVIEVICRPRILYTSNTNDTQFESICIISSITTGALKVACDRNSIPSFPPTNEEALLCVLELFNMSARELKLVAGLGGADGLQVPTMFPPHPDARRLTIRRN
jgi:hypothetical protein